VAKPAKHLQSGGQLVEILVNGQQKAGTYEIKWNGKDEEGKPKLGVYFIKLKAGEFLQTKKCYF